jgi:dTDP-4-dehydrorhamnose 3,5-epimerase
MGAIDQPSLIPTPIHGDARGVFTKPFHHKLAGCEDFAIKELFWTSSARGCVRGLHFQVPPVPGRKLVWVSRGSIVDVVVDLRKHSGFGTIARYELSHSIGATLRVPVGFAHGFQALEDDTIVNYAVDAPYSPAHDTGILWNSIEFDWPLPVGPMSERDCSFPTLDAFVSPFEIDS